LITKTNSADIKQEAMISSVYIFLITCVMIILALLITYTLNKRNKEQYFKRLYNTEVQKNIQFERFNVLLNNAYDCIILYDAKGNILDANNKALESYGYTLEEIKLLNVKNIRAPENRANISDIIDSLKHSEGIILETLHQTKIR
jgi:PAS domain-containing protein